MKRGVILLFLLLLASACEKNSYSKFSYSHKVYFSCDTSQSPFDQITSPGRFISVRKSEGHLHMVDPDGKKYDQELSEIQNGAYIMGLAGLILGTPLLSTDDYMSVFAYDLGCPECNSQGTRLKIEQQGAQAIASCTKCEGLWNLNTDGASINTDGKQRRPLFRYPTSFNNGILTVSN